MRAVIALALILAATPAVAQQPEPVVVPTYTPETVCYQTVPCAATACYQTVPCAPVTPRVEVPPCPSPSIATLPCGAQTPPVVVRYEMRSKALFWTGALLTAGGATLIVGSMTWARESVPTTFPALPCGTDPYFAQHANIAPCQTSVPLLAAGVSMVGTGALLMYVGSERVAVGTDGKHVTVRVRF